MKNNQQKSGEKKENLRINDFWSNWFGFFFVVVIQRLKILKNLND